MQAPSSTQYGYNGQLYFIRTEQMDAYLSAVDCVTIVVI
jgi:hypothetical protein